MKLKILAALLSIGFFCYSTDNNNNDKEEIVWGQTGHRVVGQIAYMNLTKKAKKNIEKLLGGEGLAIISTFPDDIKSDHQYDNFKPWHYINFEGDETYEESKKNPKGDLIIGIQKCKDILSNPTSSMKDKVFYIKFLVHLIGDLHQPMHIGKSSDRGGNSIRLKWFRGNANLHSVWDSKMIESFGMTYSELSSNLNNYSEKQVAYTQQGSVLDWVNETRITTNEIYKSAKNGDTLKYRYMYDHFDTVKVQLRKGGLRLAKVLNDLFG
jgi:hypothetical protein